MEYIAFMIDSLALLIAGLINQKKKSPHPLFPDHRDEEENSPTGTGPGLVAELQKKIAEHEEHRKKLREYGKSRIETHHDNIDAVLLGPRSSGKTSLASLWANPLSHNETPEANVTWRMFDINMYEFDVEKKYDPLFDVERNFKRVLRLRLRDFPGEVAQIPAAIKMIDELSSKTTIIFMLQVDFSNGNILGVDENAEYFNAVFVEQIRRGLREILESVAKVYIVFNKVDLLPVEWTESEMLERLINANDHPVSFIKRVFGPLVEYHIISVRKNLGIVNLLGDLGHVAIDVANEQVRFRKRIANFLTLPLSAFRF